MKAFGVSGSFSAGPPAGLGGPAPGELSSLAALVSAIDGARSVELGAYLMRDGALVRALEAAGDRGATVHVALEDVPYARDPVVRVHLVEQNRAVLRELRAHHVEAGLSDFGESPLHMKAAIVDGVAFLDDRNWPEHGGDSIVTIDNPDDVAIVRAALGGTTASSPHLATEKAGALALEAELIAATPAQTTLSCETEVIGDSPVVDALRARAAQGERVRVLVERDDLNAGGAAAAAVRRLREAGAEIRVCSGREKFAIAGDEVWLGSANATGGEPDARDWGLRTTSFAIVDHLRARFESRWVRAEPSSQP